MSRNSLREDWRHDAKVLWDTHPHRLVDAWGSNVYKVTSPLVISGTDAVLDHTVTLVEAGTGESTIANAGVSGGGLLITTAGNEDDGLALQDNNLQFKLAAPVKIVYFGIRFKLSEATQSDFLAGLTVAVTTPLSDVEDGLYFKKVDGSTSITWTSSKDTTDTVATLTPAPVLAADTYKILEFYADIVSGKIYIYVDGVRVGTHVIATNAVNEDELMSFNFQTLNGSAAARTCTIDWRRIIAIGGRDGQS